MKLEELMSLKIKDYPDILNKVFEKATAEYNNKGASIIDRKLLISINDEYRLFKTYWKDVLKAAEDAKQYPCLIRYIYLLKNILKDSELSKRVLPQLAMPASDRKSPAFDLAPIFSIIPFLPEFAQDMKKRQVPQDVISDTVKGIEECIDGFYDRNGRPGINNIYVKWLSKFVHKKILRIKRFNFEMVNAYKAPIRVFKSKSGAYKILIDNADIHQSGLILGSAGCKDKKGAVTAKIQETAQHFEGYPVDNNGYAINKKALLLKIEWQPVLSTGDQVIHVHIPAKKKLTQQICDDSYDEAKKIFNNHYPDFKYKAFCCHSWMMDPQLKNLLGRETNLTRFQKKYMLYPIKSAGKGVFYFVFLKPKDTKVEDLQEDTGLQRAIKSHYLNGGYVYEHGGVFF